MNAVLKFSTLLSLIFIIVSCNENVEMQDWSKPFINKIALSCTLGSFEDNPVSWKSNDRIGLFCKQLDSENEALVISASSVGSDKGRYYMDKAWEENKDYHFIAYYPYHEDCSESKIAGSLPKSLSQKGEEISQLFSSNIYAGKTSKRYSRADEFAEFILKPVFKVLNISFKSAKYAGSSLDKVYIKSKSAETLSGAWIYDIETGALNFTEPHDEVSINITDVSLSEEGSHVYFLFGGAENFTAPFTIEVTITKGTDILILTGDADVSSSTIINLDAFSSSGGEDDSINLADPEGDGLVETANCYIAGKAGKTYRFPATIMGNGYTTAADNSYTVNEGVLGSSPGITPSVLAPVSAKILWQTAPALMTDVTLKNNFVYFKLNGEECGALNSGNALIAVYDGENCTGNILWSWHIWITDADIESKVQTWKVHSAFDSYSSYQNPQLMDRNLGALSQRGFEVTGKNTDHGLYYQWGRKDPFVGTDDSKWGSDKMRETYDSNGEVIGFSTEASSQYSSEVKWTYVNKVHLKREDIGKYPMAFYYSGTTKNNQFWLEEICHDLWGCPGYADESNNIGHKTIYDPCPPGYRVMNAYVATGMTSKPGGGKYTEIGEGSNILNYSTYISNKEALQVKCNDTETAYLPATGMMFFEKPPYPAKRTGSYGYLWTSKMTSRYTSRAYRLHFDSANFLSMGNGFVSYGHNVRCEKIK